MRIANLLVLTITCFLSSVGNAQEANEETGNKQKSVVDVSIIGNSELPKVQFNLPWRLPSVEKRGDQSPSVDIQNLMNPIEPKKHRQLVYFSRYLEVDLPSFKTR